MIDQFKNRGWWLVFGVIFTIAILLRMNGLFRGLTNNYAFHPDASKQVVALGNFLQGHYVWYVGSLFYDGYPLGLNHLDEIILRLFLSIRVTFTTLISPETQVLVQPDKVTLYYWAQSLRVVYGMVCLALLYQLTHQALNSRGAALSALSLAGIAPLAIVVSHSATGDIGVDLFALITFACLSAYAYHSSKIWLFCAGVATGLAFSCKYQGALAGIAIGLFILLEFVSHRRILQAFASASLALTGGFIGVVAGTPAVFINWARTWKNIRDNFGFIQQYNVSPEFLTQPVGKRLLHSLAENTPDMISALGWTITLLAFTGLVFASREFHKALHTPERNAANLKKAILPLSLLAFPFLALFISTAGKPEVQPFHFSYLQPALIFGAAYALQNLWQQGFRYKIIAAILLITALTESACITQRESFFWGRGDNLHWSQHLVGETFKEPLSSTGTPGIVKTVYLESGGLAVFRNRAITVTAPNADFWNQVHIAPIPDVPFSLDQDWLFPNGPVFPRNDRYFKIQQDLKTMRHVVLYSSPTAIQFGLRSGSYPAQITLSYGGERRQITLTPHSQSMTTITPSRWRRSLGNREIPNGCFLVPLEIQAQGGNAWVTLLMDEHETRIFNFYGGMVQERSLLKLSDIPTREQSDASLEMRYLEGESSDDLIPPEPPTPGYRFPKEGFVLPCGPYLLEYVIQCQTPNTEIALKLDDFHSCQELTPFEATHHLEAGYQVLTSRFTKAFAPYEVQLELKVLRGRCRLLNWSIRPDVAQIQNDLQNWAKGGNRPVWLSPGKGIQAPAWDKAPIFFGNRMIRLSRLTLPTAISKRENVLITCEMAFERFGFPHLDDDVFFIHMLNAQGHTVHTFNFPLWQTFALGALNIPFRFEPPTQLPPGEYDLELGVYNTRIEKRLPIEGESLSKIEQQKRHHVFGRIALKD